MNVLNCSYSLYFSFGFVTNAPYAVIHVSCEKSGHMVCIHLPATQLLRICTGFILISYKTFARCWDLLNRETILKDLEKPMYIWSAVLLEM